MKPISSRKLLMPFVTYKSFLMLGSMIFVTLFSVFLVMMIPSQLSNFHTVLYTGTDGGWYNQLGTQLAKQATSKNGKITTIQTNGSVDNLAQLLKDKKPAFAFIQGSLPLPSTGLSVIAKLTENEMVYIIGKNLEKEIKMSLFNNETIAIGPEGSGTAQLAQTLFSTDFMHDIHPHLKKMEFHKQVQAVTSGEIPFGIFVFSQKSPLIKQIFSQENMTLANLTHCNAIAKHFHYLSCGTIDRGFFSPLSDIPPSPVNILQTDILLIANTKVSNSDVVSMLSLLKSQQPLIIQLNRKYSGVPNVPFSEDARRYFNEGGSTIADRYIPWLTNFLPFAILLQIAMGIGILFKGAASLHRFQVWRIDTARINLTNQVKTLLQQENPSLTEVKELILAYKLLLDRTRIASQRMLVPMGTEMLYRYQEDLIFRERESLNDFLKVKAPII
ncbi:hypothetical protein KAH37_10645 [bacterium]|nr:hypothetical protein [bacterium]